jgi:hypothetical protein
MAQPGSQRAAGRMRVEHSWNACSFGYREAARARQSECGACDARPGGRTRLGAAARREALHRRACMRVRAGGGTHLFSLFAVPPARHPPRRRPAHGRGASAAPPRTHIRRGAARALDAAAAAADISWKRCSRRARRSAAAGSRGATAARACALPGGPPPTGARIAGAGGRAALQSSQRAGGVHGGCLAARPGPPLVYFARPGGASCAQLQRSRPQTVWRRGGSSGAAAFTPRRERRLAFWLTWQQAAAGLRVKREAVAVNVRKSGFQSSCLPRHVNVNRKARARVDEWVACPRGVGRSGGGLKSSACQHSTWWQDRRTAQTPDAD